MQDKLDKWKLHGLRIWTIIGAGIVLFAILQICGILKDAVAIIIASALIVFLLHGIVNKLEARKIPRTAGTAITLIGALAIIIVALAFFVPDEIKQFVTLFNSMPSYIEDVRDFVLSYTNSQNAIITTDQMYELFDKAQQWFTDSAADIASTVASGALGVGQSVGNFFLIASISFLVSFWVLIDLPKLSQEFMGLFDTERQEVLSVIGNAFGTAIYGWSKATIICALLKGFLVGIIYAIIGVPYASVLGFMSAILYVIPYIGPVIAYVLAGALALTAGLPMCVAAVLINLVAQESIAQILSPRLMKSSVNVHPAIILVVLIVGQALGGILGMLAAIPVMAAVQSLFVTFFEANTGKTLYSEDGALFHKDKETSISTIRQAADTTLTNLHKSKK